MGRIFTPRFGSLAVSASIISASAFTFPLLGYRLRHSLAFQIWNKL